MLEALLHGLCVLCFVRNWAINLCVCVCRGRCLLIVVVVEKGRDEQLCVYACMHPSLLLLLFSRVVVVFRSPARSCG